MSLQWSHQNIVTRHQGTMRQSRLRHKMRDEESLETGFAFCWVAVQQTSSRGWKNCLLFSTILISESASNNPSLVFVINSKSLIYIFQLLDVWICSEERREAWVQAADSGGRGQRGEEKPFEIPSTDNTDNKHTTSRAFLTTTVNLFLKTPFSVFSPSAWWVMCEAEFPVINNPGSDGDWELHSQHGARTGREQKLTNVVDPSTRAETITNARIAC